MDGAAEPGMNATDPTSPATTDPRMSIVLLAHDRLLGRRLLLHTRARYVLAGTLAAGAVVADRLVGIEGLDVPALVLLATVIALYNTAIRGLARRRCDPERAAGERGFLRLLLLASVLLDYLALTVTIWLLGGARSPFLAFYLFHVVITSFLLPRPAAALSTALAVLCLAVLVTGEYAGLIPRKAPVGLVQTSNGLDGRLVLAVIVIYSTLFVLTSLLVGSLTHMLRESERANQEKARQLERLSSMRKDFLLVALHDINSPIGVVTMLLRNLRAGICGPLAPAQEEQLDRTLKHLRSLEEFLQDLRTLSHLDAAEIEQHSTEIPVAFLMQQVIEEETDHARSRRQTLRMAGTDTVALVWGVPRLIREALANYVTNAIKYTPEAGVIEASVSEGAGVVRVEVRDSGIGISQEDQQRLFREFVRVGREHPLAREAKGTGLGLSLVRRIVEAHGGRVGVESEPAKGSTFWLELPSCRAVSADGRA